MTLTSWRAGRAALVLGSTARAVLGTLALLLLVSTAPALLGWQTTVVMSGSMEPSVSPGDVVLARPVATGHLRVGEVLLVDDPDVPGRLRLHRLAAVEDGGLQLKGDANPAADSTLVAPAAVHGRAALRLPDLGLPVLWTAEHRWLPVTGTGLGVAALLALALAPRPVPTDGGGAPPAPPAPGGGPRGRLRWPRAARRTGIAVLAAGLVGAVPGAYATFSATTANDADSFAAATYFTCRSAAAGASAAQYLPLQESTGTSAANYGSYSGSGTYAGGVTYRAAGPSCGDATSAVKLDGSSAFVWTGIGVNNPQTFSTQLWFNTRTTSGGYLIGFGNGTNGDTSTQKDRLVYLTNAGKLVFGVYSGTPETVTTPASYNDGRWHLVTATFSGSTGLRLYVDGALRVSDPGAGDAEPYTGYFRVGYDSLSGWPSAPTSYYLAGSVAHAGVFASVLSASEIAAQYAAGS